MANIYDENDNDYGINKFFNSDGTRKGGIQDSQNLDYTVNRTFNADGTRKDDYRLNSALKKSTKVPPVKNSRRSKQKPKGMKKIAKKSLALIALVATLTVVAQKFVTSIPHTIETNKNKAEIVEVLQKPVKKNIETYGYNIDTESLNWGISRNGIENISESILYDNKEYDIDTRIYGAYTGLNEYKRDEFINKIFNEMSTKAAENSEELTNEELHACLFGTFDEYIEDKFPEKNASYEECKDEYLRQMDYVVELYAQEMTAKEKSEKEAQAIAQERQEILDDINLGGGSR